MASLLQNLRLNQLLGAPAADPSTAACTVEVCSPSDCQLEVEMLSLTEEQTDELSSACVELCVQVERVDTKVEERLGELRAMLTDTDWDAEAVEQAVGDVCKLRRESLELSVRSVERVRDVLEPEQVGRLLESCVPAEIR